jgi:outer membrane protein assembly factor BamC
MNNIFQLVIVVCLMLSGCSWLGIEDNRGDYLLSSETEVIVVPEKLSASRLGQIYPIPHVSGAISSQSSIELPRPQPISANTFEQLVKIQSIDNKRWILVNNSPSELWPRVRNVLNQNGIPSKRVDGSAGIIETTWLGDNSDPEKQHRFKFSIAPGVQVNSTEISVVHQSKLIDAGELAWPKISNLDDKEKDMIVFLANQLVAQPDYASVSLLARDIGGASKVEVINPDIADPYILVKLSYDRTWASINYSASRGGFTLIDHDSAQGFLMVNYLDELLEEKSSGISSWFGLKDKNNDDIIEANYRILVREVEAAIEVRIVGLEGDSLEKEQALKLLNIFRSNMS